MKDQRKTIVLFVSVLSVACPKQVPGDAKSVSMLLHKTLRYSCILLLKALGGRVQVRGKWRGCRYCQKSTISDVRYTWIHQRDLGLVGLCGPLHLCTCLREDPVTGSVTVQQGYHTTRAVVQ